MRMWKPTSRSSSIRNKAPARDGLAVIRRSLYALTATRSFAGLQNSLQILKREGMAAPKLATVENLKVPPHSIEGEQAVLGGLLLSPRAWDQVADVITETDFYARIIASFTAPSRN